MHLVSTHTRAQLFHAVDLVAGHLLGNRCPNCASHHGELLARKHGGLGSIYRCAGCALYYRPTGLQGERVTRWYYSFCYGDDPHFTTAPVEDPTRALAQARAAGKDRSALVEAALAALPAGQRSICVLGASWGYELLTFARLGVPLYGIEPGEHRREHGRKHFGLELYPSVDAAAAAGRSGGLLFSSHVLEHVPNLSDTLDELAAALAPALSLHLTPRVDPFDTSRASAIGREHPIGVTLAFWRRRAAALGAPLFLAHHRPEPGAPASETLALVARPGQPLPELDAAMLGVETPV
ncbi:MAG: hypothetical protein GC161_18575 [Planctomycetaceae bacterium]|nr:hypothetical protein [Planctomycetaceae bacterium]